MITRKQIKEDLEAQIEAVLSSLPIISTGEGVPLRGLNSGKQYFRLLSDMYLHRGKVIRDVTSLEIKV